MNHEEEEVDEREARRDSDGRLVTFVFQRLALHTLKDIRWALSLCHCVYMWDTLSQGAVGLYYTSRAPKRARCKMDEVEEDQELTVPRVIYVSVTK